jgi:hypothetical protein
MALARVHTTNYFSLSTFEQHVKVAWSPAREMNFQHIEETYLLYNVLAWGIG